MTDGTESGTRATLEPCLFVAGFRCSGAAEVAGFLSGLEGSESPRTEEGQRPQFFGHNHGLGIRWYQSLLPRASLVVDREFDLVQSRAGMQRLLITCSGTTVVVAVGSPLRRFAALRSATGTAESLPSVPEILDDDVLRERILAPGRYFDVLERVLDRHQRDRVVVVVADTPGGADMSPVLRRVGVDHDLAEPPIFPSSDVGEDGLERSERQLLGAYYRLANERMEDMLGVRLAHWK